jgi:hypothetical protein
MVRLLPCAAFAVAAIFIGAPDIRAQTPDSPSDSLVTVTLKSGESYVGFITAQDDLTITIRTATGVFISVPRNQIAQMTWVTPSKVAPPRWRKDPNYSRLLVAPTGRPLEQGDGYFSDIYVFLVGVGVGMTDQIGMLVGMSIVPGVGLDEQVFYIAPKIGHQFNENFAASIGTLFAHVNETSAGLLWGVATFGPVESSLTAGLAWGYVKYEGNADFELTEEPTILIGGAVQMSNSLSLVSENWLILGAEPSEMPFSIALRLFGEGLSADLGFILVGEILQEGLPVPWLSICYNF